MAHHLGGVERLRSTRIFIHYSRQQILVEAAPVDADAHRLVVLAGQLDHLRELLVLFLAETDVTRVDAVLGQRLGAGRVLGQQTVAVVVKIADQRHVAVHPVEMLADFRHGGGGFRRIDGDAHQFRPGARQFGGLQGGGQVVGSIGVGHRLDDNRGAATDLDMADQATARQALGDCTQGLTPGPGGRLRPWYAAPDRWPGRARTV